MKEAYSSPKQIKEDIYFWLRIMGNATYELIELEKYNPSLDFSKLRDIVQTEVNNFWKKAVPTLGTREIMKDEKFIQDMKVTVNRLNS